jgi:hypothetical protein
MRHELDGVVSFTGTLAENKAERRADVTALAKQIGDEAFDAVDVERAALNAGTTGTNRQNIRSTYQAIFDRAVSLIQEINACTTLEEVWGVDIQFDNLTLNPVPETNLVHVSGAPNVALSNAETTIGSVTITPSHAGAKIKLEARCDLTKDSGTTVRVATIAIRNGANMIGQRCIARSQGVASSDYGPAVIFEVDSPGTTNEVTYTLRGILGAGASTATRATLTATEL